MAGRQVNFFLGPSDQVPFEMALRGVGDLVILESRSRTAEPETRQTTEIVCFGKEPLRVILARPVDLANLTYRLIEGRGNFASDSIFMPIVEFDRCYVSEHLIRPGRLYFLPQYYDDSRQLVAKSDAFVRWANGLIAAAKKALTKIEHNFYAGAGALQMRSEGVLFEGLT